MWAVPPSASPARAIASSARARASSVGRPWQGLRPFARPSRAPRPVDHGRPDPLSLRRTAPGPSQSRPDGQPPCPARAAPSATSAPAPAARQTRRTSREQALGLLQVALVREDLGDVVLGDRLVASVADEPRTGRGRGRRARVTQSTRSLLGDDAHVVKGPRLLGAVSESLVDVEGHRRVRRLLDLTVFGVRGIEDLVGLREDLIRGRPGPLGFPRPLPGRSSIVSPGRSWAIRIQPFQT